jgi:hypothetical protein
MRRSISTAVAGLCCALVVEAGAMAAATETAVAGSSGDVRGRVVIDCVGGMRFGPPGPAHGRCTITGAITDRGWFKDDAVRVIHPHGRRFRSAKGTIELSVYEERGHWRIIGGTGRYAGLRGRGWEALFLSLPGGISFTMTGTVSQ